MGTSEGTWGTSPSGDELEFQPHWNAAFRTLSQVSGKQAVFVWYAAAIHKQIDINLCSYFLFKNIIIQEILQY